ncbi:hypothetical protein ABZP36_008899 [Zizania latifolia]
MTRTTPLPDRKALDMILDKLQKKDTYGVFAEPVDSAGRIPLLNSWNACMLTMILMVHNRNSWSVSRMLAQKLSMNYDEAELWIMNLVRNSKLDAKIDSVSGTLIMTTNHVDM